MFELEISEQAQRQLEALAAAPPQRRRYKAVQKALRFLRENPRHPGLNTHEWKGQKCPHGDKIWEAYAQNKTPGAYRIFFCYPPNAPDTICILAITPHP